MRLLIDTSGIQFRVAGPAKPRPDFKDKEQQATTPDGRPIWTVRLTRSTPGARRKETIWVEVAGDEPKLTFDGLGRSVAWCSRRGCGRDSKIQDRANSAPTRSSRLRATARPSTRPEPVPASAEPIPLLAIRTTGEPHDHAPHSLASNGSTADRAEMTRSWLSVTSRHRPAP